MDNRTPIRIYDAEGQLIGLVTKLRAAATLLSDSEEGATLWFGSENPQLIYTADFTRDDWRYIDRFATQELLSEALMSTWAEHKSLYESEAARMGEDWWEDFNYYVWSDSAKRLQEEEDAYNKKEDAETLHALMRRMVPTPAETESGDDENPIRYDEDSLTYKAFGPSPGSND